MPEFQNNCEVTSHGVGVGAGRGHWASEAQKAPRGWEIEVVFATGLGPGLDMDQDAESVGSGVQSTCR